VSCAGRSSRSCKSSSLGSRLHNHRTLSRSRVGARVHRRRPHEQWARVKPLSRHCQELDQRHCSGKQELRQKPEPLSTASPSPSCCILPRRGGQVHRTGARSSCPVSSRTTALSPLPNCYTHPGRMNGAQCSQMSQRPRSQSSVITAPVLEMSPKEQVSTAKQRATMPGIHVLPSAWSH
jgi:hypothetical protein